MREWVARYSSKKDPSEKHETMRLLFDLLPTQSPLGNVYHGGAEYTQSVFERILDAKQDNYLAAIYNSDNRFTPEFSELVTNSKIPLIDVKNKEDLQRAITSGTFQRFYSALPHLRWGDVDFGQVDLAVTLHGLRALERPTDRYETRYLTGPRKLQAIAKRVFPQAYTKNHARKLETFFKKPARSVRIITDSNHSKYALLNLFPYLNTDQVSVFYAPPTAVQRARSSASSANAVLNRYCVEDREYFLLVSAQVWIKNAYRAVVALDELYSEHNIRQKTLILGAGNRSLFPVQNQDKFVFAPYTSVQDLTALYSSAYCLVYPSLNEGFGYPPLECMSLGTPVICSAVTSLPEICGQAVIYVDPYSVTEIRTRILYLLNEPGVWEHYVKCGKEHGEIMFRKQARALTDLANLLLFE